MKTKIVNLRFDKFDVYIGRRYFKFKQSDWANPYRIGLDGTREEVIKKYKEYLLNNKELLNRLEELKGKILGCWCKPLPCHGDVLVRLIEKKGEK